ncbi:hypothetical protein HNR39_003436 [Glaciimonas immobilis]|uniref:Uncharacterized protein n=1 Tax=Glaciimonas immobilis TaxID=728004 RepID=A0A840RVF7_9BURK|nr:hypothetical protein [Glaciimonas immobilis]
MCLETCAKIKQVFQNRTSKQRIIMGVMLRVIAGSYGDFAFCIKKADKEQPLSAESKRTGQIPDSTAAVVAPQLAQPRAVRSK